MIATNKALTRAAVLIHAQSVSSNRPECSLYLPTHAWARIQQFQRQIGLARRRGWHGAAARLTKDLVSALNACRGGLEDSLRQLPSRPAEGRRCSALDIYRDLAALKDEFQQLDIDLKQHELAVTTDRILLDDFDFGPFQIRLDWHKLGSPQPYRVVALEPYPAARNEDVTHPHVQQEQLCEGEGRAAIRAALSDCRLYDFFLLVSRLLHTYARGSAFVELGRWGGVPCETCSEWVNEEHRYRCHRCEATLCSECSETCQGCGESFCYDCLGRCAVCDEQYCSSCLTKCRLCRQPFCGNCGEDDLCQGCYQKQHEEKHEHDLPEDVSHQPVPA